jgi:sugar phosphate isomerase/epimerase
MMRIGVLTKGETEQLDWARSMGFRSIEWMRFDESPAAAGRKNWKPYVERLADEAKSRDLRISAIGALYRNPLDPDQSDHARAIFIRAIEVAGHIGTPTVAGFPGAVIETEVDARGGQPIIRSFERHFPQLLAFWEPLAKFAADHGVRIAFEHCPQGAFHLPIMGYNMLAQPALWERLFNETRQENIGLEWDPSHLVCQFIDPLANVRKFGARIFHVHAKDASINRPLLATYGICHPGVAEHRFPGLGESNWAEIIHALLRAGYDSDLNIEGWHDPVFRDHPDDEHGPLAGRRLENTGLMIARRHLAQFLGGPDPASSTSKT